MEEQERKNLFKKFNSFYHKCVRVFRVARKPTGQEIKQTSKVSALGLLVIGLIGFIVFLFFMVFFK